MRTTRRVVVETAGEVSGTELPDCGCTVCMASVLSVFSVCFGLQGNMQLEQLQSGAREDEGREKAPAGEIWHTDKMLKMMHNHVRAPKVDRLGPAPSCGPQWHLTWKKYEW